jgi:hypothetical protein
MSFPASDAPRRSIKPLGLPVGSVRALLAVAVLARLVLDVQAHGEAASWLVAAALIHVVSYFSARSAGAEGPRGRAPLGLPRGTIRLLLLLALGVTAWLYLRQHGIASERLPILWVLGGYAIGVVARALFLGLNLPHDAGTPGIYHLQALVTLAAAVGLVLLGLNVATESPAWVGPLLAAFTTYYAGVR